MITLTFVIRANVLLIFISFPVVDNSAPFPYFRVDRRFPATSFRFLEGKNTLLDFFRQTGYNSIRYANNCGSEQKPTGA
jgi:hypothetical protein